MQKIEKGDLSVAIGLAFEVATLVGVELFNDGRASPASHIARADDKLTVLPGAVRKRRKARIDDDF